jgi:2-dehydro-3-deoxy-D-arabinonate dehydratase
MYLTRHRTTSDSAIWALDGRGLPQGCSLASLLQLSRSAMIEFLQSTPRNEAATGELLAPIEADQEIWASGVTYLRSREAREAESTVKDVYARVYDATRPELFFKAIGWPATRCRSAFAMIPRGTCPSRS